MTLDFQEAEYEKHGFPAHRIFNVGETCLNILQSEFFQVAGHKDRLHKGTLTSAGRNSLVTLAACMGTECVSVPHMLIFPRTNRGDQLMRDASQGASGTCHPSTWMQPHLFTDCFHNLIAETKHNNQSYVLLFVLGCFSHTRNLDLIQLA